jgi:beta-glucosidase
LKIKDERRITGYSKRFIEFKISKELAENKAQSAKIALITLGRNAGEEADRNIDEDFNLANDELNLIETVADAFHAQGKKVVVILNIGGVIETASWKNKVDAILYLGNQVRKGNSVADVF